MQMRHEANSIIIVSGWRMVGKTTFCNEVIQAARQKGLKVCGLLSFARFKDGKKVGIDIQDVFTEENYPLAVVNQGQFAEVKTDAWVFDADRVAWGNNLLETIVSCDILVIDELGPLEFFQQQGFVAGFKALKRDNFRLALVVIRPELLNEAKERWPDAQVMEINSINISSHVEEAVRQYIEPLVNKSNR